MSQSGLIMEVVLDTPSAALKRSGYRTRKVSVSSGSQLDTETEAEEDKSVARPSKRLKVSHSRVADTLPGSLAGLSPGDSNDDSSATLVPPEQDITYYSPTSDEQAEKDAVLSEETASSEYMDESGNGVDLPIRLLYNFTVYRLDTKEVVPMEVLRGIDEGSMPEFGASGDVLAHAEGQDIPIKLKPGSKRQTVALAGIKRLNVHDWPADRELDSYVYLETATAWYIVVNPSKTYRRFYRTFYLQHSACHFFLMACIDKKLFTYQDFAKNAIADVSDGMFEYSLEELLSDEVIAYVASQLQDVADQSRRFRENTLFNCIFQGDYSGEDDGSDGAYSDAGTPSEFTSRSGSLTAYSSINSGTPSKTEGSGRKRKRTARPKSTTAPKSVSTAGMSSTPTVTPMYAVEETAVQKSMDRVHELLEEDPKYTQWGDLDGETGYYLSVRIDGTLYSLNDVVMVNPGEDEDSKRQTQQTAARTISTNLFANKVWFIRIRYFYEEDGRKLFHGQWYEHGSRVGTVGGLVHPQELVCLPECTDCPVSSIFRKCDVRTLDSTEHEPVISDDPRCDQYFCRLELRNEGTALVDLPTEAEVGRVMDAFPDACYICALEKQQVAWETLRKMDSTHGFSYQNLDYHVNDFVYVSGDILFNIARIDSVVWRKGISQPDVTLQEFVRYNDHDEVSNLVPTEERRLIMLANKYSLKFSVDKGTGRVTDTTLAGRCHVRFLSPGDYDKVEEWVASEGVMLDYQEHFYVLDYETSDGKLSPLTDKHKNIMCDTCVTQREEVIERRRLSKQTHEKLRGLELFAGAGGLSTGMDMSNFIETICAVELMPAAAKTFRHNHPGTEVVAADVNKVLKYMTDVQKGQIDPETQPFEGLDEHLHSKIPTAPNSVDFIYGGAPCQAFSGANHNPVADDPRTTLPATMLSFVEYHRPKFFLLENVPGILRYKLMAKQGDRRLLGGMEAGVVKLVFRVLMALGYQVSVQMVQALHYGSPQDRKRTIFLAALRGERMPQYPLPTHASPTHTRNVNGIKMESVRRPQANPNHHGAPFRPVVTEDILTDLPLFEWKNPHRVVPATRKQRERAEKRAASGILQLSAVQDSAKMGLCGFQVPVPYAKEPQNQYQRDMRVKGLLEVSSHYNKRHVSHIIEAITTMPHKIGANHRDLPRLLQPKNVRDAPENSREKVYYGRLDPKGHFGTVMTGSTPASHGIKAIHPWLNRVLTIRETARVQGFPDHQEFLSMSEKPTNDQYKQIGNAVPVPLALAFGREIGRVLLDEWDEGFNERELSPEA